MPRYKDGKYEIVQKFEDGQYIKTSLIQSMLKDILVVINDIYLKVINNFTSTITLPQMTNVIIDINDPTSAVPYGTTDGNYSVPIGGILMYTYESFYKYGLPEDFEICDGNNNTPDLKKHFELDYIYIKKVR